MPPKKKYSREQIVNSAFELARVEGIEGLTARRVADELGSSVAPIYVNFSDIKELKKAVANKAFKVSQEMSKEEITGDRFLDIGIASLRFAKEYSALFRELVLKKNDYMEDYDKELGNEIIQEISNETQLRDFTDEELGIFAQKNGFDTLILEKHHTLGGECTGWDRQDYHIDGCIHWLVGTKKGTPIRELWETVGALDGVDIYNPESFMVVEHEGVTVHFYRDLERLKSSWLKISPEDKDIIEDFCKDIKKLHSFSVPVGKPLDMMNIFEKIKYMFLMKDVGAVMNKYSKISVQDFASKFKHPALRTAISSFLPEGDYSVVSVIFPLGTFTGGQSSIPMGGSKALAMRMTDRYISLGGTVKTSSEVVGLDIEGKSVKRNQM